MAAVAHPTRPHIRRNSPLSVSNGIHGFSADAPILKRIDIGDSDSDDEPPPAIKFSKETQALLADAPLPSSPPRQAKAYDIPRFNRPLNTSRAASDTPSRAPGIKIIRKSSPTLANDGSIRGTTPSRVVQIGSTGPASTKRSISISGPYTHRQPTKREPTPTRETRQEIITPAPAPRALRVRTRSNSVTSQDAHVSLGNSTSGSASRNGARSAVETSSENLDGGELRRSASQHHASETVSRFGTSTAGRSRNPSADTAPPPGSTRVKRAPIGTGMFLKSAPARRGFRRRDSEENVSPNDEVHPGSATASSYTPRTGSTHRGDGPRSRSGSINTRATSIEPVSVHDFANRDHAPHESRPPSRQGASNVLRNQTSNDPRPPSRSAIDHPQTQQSSVERPALRRRTSVHHDDGPLPATDEPQQQRASVDRAHARPALESKPPQRAPSLRAPQYRYVGPKINTDASEDQENMPPPTFKRDKNAEFKHLGKAPIAILADEDKLKQRLAQETPVPVPAQQQERKALGAISSNTPHRAAPAPPPKMSVIDTATTTAGASVTKSKKKRSHITINGTVFTSMGQIGSGGSAKVICVMAENYKTFAVKQVKLKDCDESAMRGFKGEIDLLNKLTEVERVVRLYGWELNNDKQELLLLMEKGDLDFYRLLRPRTEADGAKFDPVFTRYHWREMLECVQAVHDVDIVHSDLKPANFLIVQGRLKLIDFGIANAIDTDNTVNVHRDTHVGTPNYMSPESITDTNAPQPGEQSRDKAGRPLGKDITIGKASDVWSLGCILYQMVYGRPPFAHISNQMVRIVAITNPKHEIQFPDNGIGGVPVPAALKGTMRRCLNRDPTQRPSIEKMLSEKDPYLHPDRPGTVVIDEDLLGQIITKVVERSKKGIPEPNEVQGYPKSFMDKIRHIIEYGS